jgi:hypothetical protein
LRHAAAAAFAAVPFGVWVAAQGACGGAPARPRTNGETLDLGEARALEVIAQTLDRLGVRHAPRWRVNVGGTEALEVDVRLEGLDYGIEYVTAQDRADHGTVLPSPPRTPELQLLAGSGEDARVQVLLLDERWYRFARDPELVQAGARSAADAEGRLARDVADFIEHVRGHEPR